MIRSLQENTLTEKPKTEPGSFKTGNLNKRFLLIFSGLIFLYLILNFWTRLFPYVDIPFHLAEATIFRYYQTPGNNFDKYYLIDAAFRPNIFHIAFAGSSIFPSVEFANKIYNAIYLILFPLSILGVIRQLKGNIWFAVLSFLLIYNFNVSFGFVGFYFSIPLSFTLLYLILRSFSDKALWIRIAISLLILFIYFVHTQTAVFCLLVYSVLNGFYYLRNFRQLLLAIATVLPVVIFILFWWFQTQSNAQTLNYLIYFYWSEYLGTFKERIAFFYQDTYFLFKGTSGIIAGCIVSALIFASALIGLSLNRNSFRQIFQDKKRVTFLLFLLITFGCYLGLPSAIPGQAFIYQRYSVYALLSVLIFASLIFPERFSKVFSAFTLLLVLVHFCLYCQKHWAFNQEMAGFTPEFFPENTGNKTLAGVMLKRDFRGYEEFMHVPDYYVVWRKAPAVVAFIDYRFGIIRRKASFEELPLYDEGYNFERTYEFPYRNMNYVLINDSIPAAARKNKLRNFRLVKRVNNWQLFERF